MKLYLPVAVAAMALCGVALAAQPADDAKARAEANAANEAAGLPDLAAINRPAAEVQSKVEFNAPRTPSFHERDANGTEITEYRDRGKPVEINVHSNFGTRYQMSAPPDTAPKVRDNGQPNGRVPTIGIHY